VMLKRAEKLKAADWNGKSDPYVILECLHQKEQSSVVKYNLNPVWNETFEFTGERQELMRDGLMLRVMDWDKHKKDDVLGEVHMPFIELEDANYHEYEVPLQKGFVHLAVEWLPEPGSAPKAAAAAGFFANRKNKGGGGSGGSGALSPACMTVQEHLSNAGYEPGSGRLQLLLVRAEGLKKADRFGKSDPYVVFTCLGREERSTVKKQTLDPLWNERFEFRGLRPAFIRGGLKMKVMDKDFVGTDDPLGDAIVNLAELEYQEHFERMIRLPQPFSGTVSITITWVPDVAPAAGASAAPSPRLVQSAQATVSRSAPTLDEQPASSRRPRRNTLDIAD